jgi:AcrR family transcriptional regulator
LPKKTAQAAVSEITVAPRGPRGQAKRQMIIDAAASLFAEKGYNATTLWDIAAKAGTQPGSLYYHFDSRDDIVREVLKSSMNLTSARVRGALEKIPPDTPYIDRIALGIRTHVESVFQSDPYTSAYFRIINEVPEEVNRDFNEHPREYGRYWHKLITGAQAAGEIRADVDPTMFRMILFSAITWAQRWFKPDGRLNVDQLSDSLIDMFMNGVLPFDGG